MILRRSPIAFTSRALQTDTREGWEVVLQYEDEGGGPFLIDLSHLPKWDVQDPDLAQIKPCGAEIPGTPGDCAFREGMLIARLNPVQALVWHLTTTPPQMPSENALTDTTDASALLALVGETLSCVAEKMTPLDLYDPSKRAPFLLQGPVLHLPVKAAVLGRKDNLTALLMACPRGYGQSFADAILDAGSEWELRPAGEKAFSPWMTG
jgi:hypothetical protein